MSAFRKQLAVIVIVGLTGGLGWAGAPASWLVSMIDPNIPSPVLLSGGLAFFADGHPAAIYAPRQYLQYQLAYAELLGSVWQISGPEAVGPAYRPALATRGSTPLWAYYFSFSGQTGLAYQDPNGWTVVDPGAHLPNILSLALNPQTGQPAFIADDTEHPSDVIATLYYYWFDGTGWHKESIAQIEGTFSCGFSSGGLVFLPDGTPAVAFCDGTTGMSGGSWASYIALRTRQPDGTWTNIGIDSGYMYHGSGTNVLGASIALRPSGEPAVSYMKESMQPITTALHFWPDVAIPVSGPAPTCLAILPDDTAVIAYCTGNALEVTSNAGGTWHTDNVISGATSLLNIAVRPTTGQPAIAFYDENAGTLRYALGYFRGDMNCDGLVDFRDINPFVLALTSYELYEQYWWPCNLMNGDINDDGRVDFRDINRFVALLTH